MSQAPKPEESSETGNATTAPKYEHRCPPDRNEIGRATWTLLHTTAVEYPESPSSEEREAMTSLLHSLSLLYPCLSCARHLREELKEYPPDVSGRDQLSRWMCDLHNRVNERLEKPFFNPDEVNIHWKDGPKGANC